MDYTGLFSSETAAAIGIVCVIFATALSIRGVGKWKALAEQYPVRQPYRGDWVTLGWLRILSGSVSIAAFRKCAKIGATKDYLYLSPPVVSFMPALQVPWATIRNPRQKKNFLQFEIDELTIELADKLLSQEILARLGIRQ